MWANGSHAEYWEEPERCNDKLDRFCPVSLTNPRMSSNLLLACIVPVQRIARLDPVVALRRWRSLAAASAAVPASCSRSRSPCCSSETRIAC